MFEHMLAHIGPEALAVSIALLVALLYPQLGDRWFAFAATGKPEGSVTWPNDNRGRGVVLDIGDQDTMRPAFMSTRLNTIITGLKWAGSRAARE